MASPLALLPDLKQLATLLQGHPPTLVGEHARRGDFSRWIGTIIAWPQDIRKIEQRYRLSHLGDARQPIAALILARYGSSADRPATDGLVA